MKALPKAFTITLCILLLFFLFVGTDGTCNNNNSNNNKKKRKNDGNGFASVAWVAAGALSVQMPALLGDSNEDDDGERTHAQPIHFHQCCCHPLTSIFEELGPLHIKKAYQMSKHAFWHLHAILEPYMQLEPGAQQHANHGGRTNQISTVTHLSVTLHYFAGGEPDDISLVHGISHC